MPDIDHAGFHRGVGKSRESLMKSPVARIQIAGWQESNSPWQGIKLLAGSNHIDRGKDSNRWLAVMKSPVARNQIAGWQESNCPWQGIKLLAGRNQIARGKGSNCWLAGMKSPVARIHIAGWHK